MNLKFNLLFFFVLTTNFLSGQNDNQLYTVVEKPPEFPGGEAYLFKYLRDNLKYPKDITEICGTMTIQFSIEKSGYARLVKCGFGGCKSNCRGIKKFIQKMPRWQPAIKNGKPIRFLYTLPIKIEPE